MVAKKVDQGPYIYAIPREAGAGSNQPPRTAERRHVLPKVIGAVLTIGGLALVLTSGSSGVAEGILGALSTISGLATLKLSGSGENNFYTSPMQDVDLRRLKNQPK